MLAAQAAARPDHVAVLHEGDSLTFRELHDAATDLARCLRGLGVTGDRTVGVFAEPSLALMVGVWGSSTRGADISAVPDYPDERLRFMLEQSGVRVIFAQEEIRGRLTEIAPAELRIITPATSRNSSSHGDGQGTLPWSSPARAISLMSSTPREAPESPRGS
ncbi:AMP-binding protein [Streptomyces sp. INA 01156]